MSRKAVALLAAGILLGVLLMLVLAARADARIEMADIAGIGPNQYQLPGANVSGSATKYVIDTLGWNATRVLGNVGIGNGSVAIFDLGSPEEVDYPDDAFMCGDVSMQPWAPVVERAAPANETARTNATENATDNGMSPAANLTGADSLNDTDRYRFQVADEGTDSDEEFVAPESPESAETEGISPTYAMYHPILLHRPVQDVMYEHPLATPGTAYCRLLGFYTPSGVPVNVGMKCTGYGY